jgi:hypothetical protein
MAMAEASYTLFKSPPAAKRPADDDLSLEASQPKLPRCTGNCSFFALPQELRDKIYRESFDEDPDKPLVYHLQLLSFRVFAISHKGPLSLTRWFGFNAPLVCDLPAWLPVSRRFLAEALGAFSQDKMFEIEQSFNMNRPLLDVCAGGSRDDDRELGHHSNYPLYKDTIDRALIKSMRTVGLSVYSVKCAPVVRKLSPADEDALSALLAHRDKKGLRLDSQVLWYLKVHNGMSCRQSDVEFESPFLSEWSNKFASVLVAITLCCPYKRTALLKKSQSAIESGEEYKTEQVAADKEARLSMYDHANYWVDFLLEKTSGVEMGSEIGEDTTHYSGIAWYESSIKIDGHEPEGNLRGDLEERPSRLQEDGGSGKE